MVHQIVHENTQDGGRPCPIVWTLSQKMRQRPARETWPQDQIHRGRCSQQILRALCICANDQRVRDVFQRRDRKGPNVNSFVVTLSFTLNASECLRMSFVPHVLCAEANPLGRNGAHCIGIVFHMCLGTSLATAP